MVDPVVLDQIRQLNSEKVLWQIKIARMTNTIRQAQQKINEIDGRIDRICPHDWRSSGYDEKTCTICGL